MAVPSGRTVPVVTEELWYIYADVFLLSQVRQLIHYTHDCSFLWLKFKLQAHCHDATLHPVLHLVCRQEIVPGA